MYPIVEMAQRTDEFSIVLWLHDGCYIDFKDSNKATRWSNRIVEAVNRQACEMGILTRLESK